MEIVFKATGYAVLVSLTAPAMAADKWLIQPIQAGQETVRYEKGVPTLDLELKDGVVQITPLPLDHGGLAFGVAVYNDGRQAANMGIENVTAQFSNGSVKILTREDLEKKAQNRAMWASIALAAAGGLAAAAAASQRNHYRSTFVTPRGTYRSYWSAPSAAGQFQATAIATGAGFGIASINNQLDQTLAALGEEVVQLTTIDPGESYAGRVVLAKIKPTALPARISLTVSWNGEVYPFNFQIAKRGTPAPSFTAITRTSDLTNFSPPSAPQPAAAVTTAALAVIQIPEGAASEGAVSGKKAVEEHNAPQSAPVLVNQSTVPATASGASSPVVQQVADPAKQPAVLPSA